MFEAAVLLAHHRKLRTDGMAGAFQSGGACTLFAEAAGTAGLTLPAFAAPTKRALRRALPSFASQNNPLDVTGQAAVETDMFVGALTALANDPAIGLVAFDAFPPRLPGETPWADSVLATVMDLQRSSGVAFASVSMSPLAYTAEAKVFTGTWGAMPFLQGHRAAAGAIRALVDAQRARGRATREMAPHANRAPKLAGSSAAAPGPSTRPPAHGSWSCTGCAGRRRPWSAPPAEAVEAARKIRSAVAVKAVAPELPHKAKLGGVRIDVRGAEAVSAAAEEVLTAARRAGAREPKVLVQEMIAGAEVLVGAVVDERFGACVTMRPGGALAEAGTAEFVAAPLGPKAARAYVEAHAAACGLDEAKHDLGAVAAAVAQIARAAHDLRDRLVSLEANPLVVRDRGRGRGRRPRRGQSTRVIEGLLAALGWGCADFFGAVVGRRIGSLWTVIIAQGFAALVATAIVVFTRGLGRVRSLRSPERSR